MNPTTVPSIFNDFLLPVTNVHNYNTRNAARCNFYRPQTRTNYGKFTFKYSASVLWEGIPTCLKKISTTNGFKRQYKINLLINYLSSVISGKYCNFIGLQECDLSINRTFSEL